MFLCAFVTDDFFRSQLSFVSVRWNFTFGRLRLTVTVWDACNSIVYCRIASTTRAISNSSARRRRSDDLADKAWSRRRQCGTHAVVPESQKTVDAATWCVGRTGSGRCCRSGRRGRRRSVGWCVRVQLWRATFSGLRVRARLRAAPIRGRRATTTPAHSQVSTDLWLDGVAVVRSTSFDARSSPYHRSSRSQWLNTGRWPAGRSMTCLFIQTAAQHRGRDAGCRLIVAWS